MGIVVCIGMMAVGAILTLAVDWDVSGLNVDVMGIILLLVGTIGLCAYISILKRRRVQPPAPGAPVVEEVNKHHWE
ncbi:MULTISPECIES: hypothetical protein [unclassified Streptomyces]|uniref:hypothetical protein n=1 Tax=unclassified Streptomyces TaxID=2593676 RepID=UPI002DDB9D2F|nr:MULTISPECIES: hypothetical protein [unclassified Streptomyces]WSA93558.1 hypothetical protein OIE63_19710 [Streptomyces sp. NBC_01795]WSB77928.1 hypothetical protein OHB04_20545 [Streptomyces sp. NBC_01775]WSS13816.1 hypothetical protein OG533_19435 [Streptomyces sp. NBC_01186]WSS42640.1 hypothetical protein OG220_20185 [Streptomyces sp. NBC_01187]